MEFGTEFSRRLKIRRESQSRTLKVLPHGYLGWPHLVTGPCAFGNPILRQQVRDIKDTAGLALFAGMSGASACVADRCLIVLLLYQYELMPADLGAFIIQQMGAVATHEKIPRPVGPLFGLAAKMATGKPLRACEVGRAIPLLRPLGEVRSADGKAEMTALTRLLQRRCRTHLSAAIEPPEAPGAPELRLNHRLEWHNDPDEAGPSGAMAAVDPQPLGAPFARENFFDPPSRPASR
jgi:hypothetical protein